MAAPTPNFILRWGMIVLPLKSFPAARNATTDLVNLHKPCIQPGVDPRLKMLKQCSVCANTVPEEEIVKGYASTKGSYVLFTPEEIEALAADKSKAMDIKGFCRFADIDPIWLGPTNFIGPVDPAALRPFLLLHTTMRENNTAALVTYYGHGRDKVGVIRATDETLMLHDAFFPAEIRSYAAQAKVQLAKTEFALEEKKLAMQLVQASTIEFLPTMSEIRDGYLDRVATLREAREAGQPMPEFSKPAPQGQVLDLLAALKASLGTTSDSQTPSKPPVKVEAKKAEAKTQKRKSA